MEHPTQQGIRNLLENGTSITTGDYWGANQISGAAERLSFDYRVVMDVQSLLLAQVFYPFSKSMLNRKMVFRVTKSQSMKDKISFIWYHMIILRWGGMWGRAPREWILEVREVKSEMEIWFTHFENEKWNENALISRSRVKSEMKMSQNRDREWKVNWKCLEIEIEKWNFSRIFEKFREILENQEIKKF